MHTNADQLKNKFSELQLLVQAQNPDIIAITEVKPKNCRYQPIVGEYILDGYNIWSTNIDSENGRGCLLYTKKHLIVKDIRSKINFDEYVMV